MSRLDYLLGVITLASAGMFAAVALQPLPAGSVLHRDANTPVAAGSPAPHASVAPDNQQPHS